LDIWRLFSFAPPSICKIDSFPLGQKQIKSGRWKLKAHHAEYLAATEKPKAREIEAKRIRFVISGLASVDKRSHFYPALRVEEAEGRISPTTDRKRRLMPIIALVDGQTSF
jgi:hypothetical protein